MNLSKGRLIVKRCTETYGIDCLKISASVIKMNIVNILLSFSISYDWKL